MKPLDQIVKNNEDTVCRWSEDPVDGRFRFRTDCGEYVYAYEQEPLAKWRYCPLCGRNYSDVAG